MASNTCRIWMSQIYETKSTKKSLQSWSLPSETWFSFLDVYGLCQQNLSASKVLQLTGLPRSEGLTRLASWNPLQQTTHSSPWKFHRCSPKTIGLTLSLEQLLRQPRCHNRANRLSYLSRALYKISFFRSGRPNLAVGIKFFRLLKKDYMGTVLKRVKWRS